MRGLVADGIATAGGGRWHQATVKDILTNPLYAGRLRTKDGVVDGAHEACVGEETFEKVQALRAARTSGSGQGRGRPPAGKHLFRKGMLRCGRCGGSMVPRTTRPGASRPGRAIRETYCCYEHTRDPSLCSMQPVMRADVDSAVYAYFEQVGLDVEATRAQVEDTRDRQLREVGALLEQAQAEGQRAEERLSRVRRDYSDGRLPAEDWISFRDELTAARDGAAAEVARLSEQEAEIRAWDLTRDLEQEALAALAEIRQAIAGEVAHAHGVDGVRAALARLFEAFVVRDAGPGQRVHAELAWLGGLVLEPVVREEAIDAVTTLRPVFRREPIYDADENQESPRSRLDLPELFGPIPIPVLHGAGAEGNPPGRTAAER